MVVTDHVYETTHDKSNGHVTDDITCPQKVNLVTPEYLKPDT